MATAQNVVQDIISLVPTAFLVKLQSYAPLNAQVAQALLPALAAKALPICFPALMNVSKIAHQDTSSHLTERVV